MLKRNQILLQDWQEEYLKFASQNYDISISEAARILINVGAISCICALFPKYKPKVSTKTIAEHSRQLERGKLSEQKFYKMISTIAFEARKATEFRMAQNKK
ncbi:MAG: hypothetical protein PHI86_00555 [Candidatus Omnitrophica bacterium]|nr:hypothetical protein [Candidatus Omnitrophota bacterium]HOX54229.1 hypothetical protein [Candidatus Omnitrophota bacterium]